MTQEQFLSYIETIIDNPRFKELDKFMRMTELRRNKDRYENILEYVSIFCCKKGEQVFRTIPDYEYFIEFIEEYINDEKNPIRYTLEGHIDLGNILYLKQPMWIAGNKGNFFDGWIVMTDNSKYILKKPLNYRGNSGVGGSSCKYVPIIASYIAKQLNIDTAEYRLAKLADDQERIISRNFLNKNEEIITYSEEEVENPTISNEMEKMTQNLVLRKFEKQEIEKVKLDFLKQEFLSKLIDLKDQKPDNSPLIISLDENGERHVRLAPMTDYDYSFYIMPRHSKLPQRMCDNGKTDIGSFIEQYKNYPGFKEFVKKCLCAFDMKKVYEQIYEDTGNPKFKDYENDAEMVAFIEFAENNIKKAKETFDRVYKEERGDK